MSLKTWGKLFLPMDSLTMPGSLQSSQDVSSVDHSYGHLHTSFKVQWKWTTKTSETLEKIKGDRKQSHILCNGKEDLRDDKSVLSSTVEAIFIKVR